MLVLINDLVEEGVPESMIIQAMLDLRLNNPAAWQAIQQCEESVSSVFERGCDPTSPIFIQEVTLNVAGIVTSIPGSALARQIRFAEILDLASNRVAAYYINPNTDIKDWIDNSVNDLLSVYGVINWQVGVFNLFRVIADACLAPHLKK
jgi:hypothetical protein